MYKKQTNPLIQGTTRFQPTFTLKSCCFPRTEVEISRACQQRIYYEFNSKAHSLSSLEYTWAKAAAPDQLFWALLLTLCSEDHLWW